MNIFAKVYLKYFASPWRKKIIGFTEKHRDVSIKHNNLIFPPAIGITLEETDTYLYFLLHKYDDIKRMRAHYTDFTIKKEVDGLTLKFDNSEFKIRNGSEISIINEIYLEKIYNFNTHPQKTIVFDIGMNIGLASIFFAKLPNVEKVFSFEPVDETYSTAQENFDLNPVVSKKINSYNFGLAKESKIERFLFNPNNKGSFGKIGNRKFSRSQYGEKEVQLRSTTQEISKIYDTLNGEFIVFKIDCEGAEYEILPELLSIKPLPNLLMIEWHFSNYAILDDLLTQKGYSTVIQQKEPTAGLIYAFKT